MKTLKRVATATVMCLLVMATVHVLKVPAAPVNEQLSRLSLYDPYDEGMMPEGTSTTGVLQPMALPIQLPSLPELGGEMTPVTLEEAKEIAQSAAAGIIGILSPDPTVLSGLQVAQIAARFPDTYAILVEILNKAVEISLSKESLISYLPYIRAAKAYSPDANALVAKKYMDSLGEEVEPYTDAEVEMMVDPEFHRVYRLFLHDQETGVLYKLERYKEEIVPLMVSLYDALNEKVREAQQQDRSEALECPALEGNDAYEAVYQEALTAYAFLLEGIPAENMEQAESLVESAASRIAEIITSEEVYPHYLAMKKVVSEHPEWEEEASLVASMRRGDNEVSLTPEADALMADYEFQKMVLILRDWQESYHPRAWRILAELRIDLNKLRPEMSEEI